MSLEPRQLDVLLCLVEGAGDVISIDRLLEQCWPGEFHGDNPVHKVIATLRKVLGDDARAPRYVATVRKRGYRIVAPIGTPPDANTQRQGGEGRRKWVFDGSRVCRPMTGRHAARWLQTQQRFAVTLSYTRSGAAEASPPRARPGTGPAIGSGPRPGPGPGPGPGHGHQPPPEHTSRRSLVHAGLVLCMSSTILTLTVSTWLAISDARRAIARADAVHRRAEAIIACHDRHAAMHKLMACAEVQDKRKGP